MNMKQIVEIRSYELKTGTRPAFHQLFLDSALPMLHRWKVEVVAYGASLHDSDSYYLIRAYTSLEDRQASQDAFYGSEEWLNGPREALLAMIETYTSIVLELDESTIAALRQMNQ